MANPWQDLTDLSGDSMLFTLKEFVKDVQQYEVLPRPLAVGICWTLPYVEIGVAALLLTGYQIRFATLVVIAMLIGFMVVVGVAMLRKLNLSCSCFGLLHRERVGWIPRYEMLSFCWFRPQFFSLTRSQ